MVNTETVLKGCERPLKVDCVLLTTPSLRATPPVPGGELPLVSVPLG